MKAITLLYHDVVERGQHDASGRCGPGSERYKVSIDEFARHLRCIKSATNRRPALVSELGEEAEGLPYLLTFDDGGVSALQIADMLEAQGWSGHFFVTVNDLDAPGFLTRAQLREIRARGHLVGSHSLSHPARMSRLSRRELLNEWTGSIAVLTDILGANVGVASVPGGYYGKHVAEAAAQSGITALFTSEPVARSYVVEGTRVFGRYAIVRGTSPSKVAALARGRLTTRIGQSLFWNAKKAAKSLMGENYLNVRRWALGSAETLKGVLF